MIPSQYQEPFVPLKHVAALTSTPLPTVRQWAKSGKLPYYKPGKALLFLMSDVMAFMALYRRRSDAELTAAAAAKYQELAAITDKAKRS